MKPALPLLVPGPQPLLATFPPQAAERYGDLDIFTSSFKPMRNTISGNEGRAFMKVIVATDSDRVVGIHMVSLCSRGGGLLGPACRTASRNLQKRRLPCVGRLSCSIPVVACTWHFGPQHAPPEAPPLTPIPLQHTLRWARHLARSCRALVSP